MEEIDIKPDLSALAKLLGASPDDVLSLFSDPQTSRKTLPETLNGAKGDMVVVDGVHYRKDSRTSKLSIKEFGELLVDPSLEATDKFPLSPPPFLEKGSFIVKVKMSSLKSIKDVFHDSLDPWSKKGSTMPKYEDKELNGHLMKIRRGNHPVLPLSKAIAYYSSDNVFSPSEYIVIQYIASTPILEYPQQTKNRILPSQSAEIREALSGRSTMAAVSALNSIYSKKTVANQTRSLPQQSKRKTTRSALSLEDSLEELTALQQAIWQE